MSLKQTKTRGFTIVELLIVIVVIAILAAITIVAYNGIQNRAKASAAQAASNTMIKKAEAANAIASAYPANLTDFNAQSDSSLTGSGLYTVATTLAAAPTNANTLNYEKCTTGNTTSARVTYWNNTTSAAVATIIGNNSPACTVWGMMAAGGPY